MAHKDELLQHVQRSPEARRSTVEGSQFDEEDEDEVSEEALARLTESFHSDRGHSKKVSWSEEYSNSGRGSSLGRYRRATLSPVLRMTPQTDQPDPIGARGRPLERAPAQDDDQDESQRVISTSTSAPRRSSRASRKRASMVFLGAWSLFGIGTLAGGPSGLIRTSPSIGQVGRVLTQPNIEHINSTHHYVIPPLQPTSFYTLSYPPMHVRDFSSRAADSKHSEQPTTEFIIGRISAWICTTLYLTSRLPQIWKNVSV